MSKKHKRSRKPRRAAATPRKPLSRTQFEREFAKVVDGDPDADKNVQAFWQVFSEATGVAVAVPHALGIEVLRKQVQR